MYVLQACAVYLPLRDQVGFGAVSKDRIVNGVISLIAKYLFNVVVLIQSQTKWKIVRKKRKLKKTEKLITYLVISDLSRNVYVY